MKKIIAILFILISAKCFSQSAPSFEADSSIKATKRVGASLVPVDLRPIYRQDFSRGYSGRMKFMVIDTVSGKTYWTDSLIGGGGGSGGVGLTIADFVTNAKRKGVYFGGVGGSFQQDSANFNYDSTNKRLGIGRTATEALDINGNIKFGAAVTARLTTTTDGTNTYVLFNNPSSGTLYLTQGLYAGTIYPATDQYISADAYLRFQYSGAAAPPAAFFYNTTVSMTDPENYLFQLNNAFVDEFSVKTNGMVNMRGKIARYNNTAITNGEMLFGHTANGTFNKGVMTSTDNTVIITNGPGTVDLSTTKDIKVVDQAVTSANNSGTGETTLQTITASGGLLANDEESLYGQFAGTFNDVAATSQLKLKIVNNSTTTTIFDSGTLTVSATGGWTVSVHYYRTGSGTAKAIVDVSTPGASTSTYRVFTALTGLNHTLNTELRTTGQAGGAGGGSNDITGELVKIFWSARTAH